MARPKRRDRILDALVRGGDTTIAAREVRALTEALRAIVKLF